MIEKDAMVALVRAALPDAEVDVFDLTGTKDHLRVLVRSRAFAGKSPLDRHRMVESAVAGARADGRLHALEVRTEVLE
ncbi:MAG: BolA/IbaG family iron-sulfur metabolism protein [Candidatus Baltobacteraceae bacterium]